MFSVTVGGRLWAMAGLTMALTCSVQAADPPASAPSGNAWQRWAAWAKEGKFASIVDDLSARQGGAQENLDHRLMGALVLIGLDQLPDAQKYALANFPSPTETWAATPGERQKMWFSALVANDLLDLAIMGARRRAAEYERVFRGIGWVRVDLDELRQILGVRADASAVLQVRIEADRVTPFAVRMPASTPGVERLPYWTGKARVVASGGGGEREAGAEVAIPAPGDADAVAKLAPWPPIGIRYDAAAGMVHWTLEGPYAGKPFELWIQLAEKHRVLLRKPVSASGSATVESLKAAAREAAGPIRNTPVFDPGSGVAYDLMLMPTGDTALSGTMITIGGPTSRPSAGKP